MIRLPQNGCYYLLFCCYLFLFYFIINFILRSDGPVGLPWRSNVSRLRLSSVRYVLLRKLLADHWHKRLGLVGKTNNYPLTRLYDDPIRGTSTRDRGVENSEMRHGPWLVCETYPKKEIRSVSGTLSPRSFGVKRVFRSTPSLTNSLNGSQCLDPLL